MTNIVEHLEMRNNRYFINTKTDSFLNKLKGLAVIEVCITELCTRKCGFCPRSDNKIYPNQRLFMTLDTVSSLGRECKDQGYEGDFHVSGFGESLTHPAFFELIKTLKSFVPNNRIALTTNGDLLTQEKCKQVYESGIDHIILSCYDGINEYNSFETMLTSVGGSFDIRKLWLSENETLAEMAERNKFNNRSGAVTSIDFTNNFNKHKNNSCYLPFYKLVIDYNGDVLLCCNDWFRRHKGLGNINNTNLYDIWYSNEFKNVRENLKQGIRNSPACSNCSIQGDLVGIESVIALQ